MISREEKSSKSPLVLTNVPPQTTTQNAAAKYPKIDLIKTIAHFTVQKHHRQPSNRESFDTMHLDYPKVTYIDL